MKKFFVVLLAIIVLAAVFLVYNNTNPDTVISELTKQGSIRPGELNYQIQLFGFIPVGNAVFKTAQEIDFKGEKAYYLNASAQSLNSISGFFAASAMMDTYLDKTGLNPMFFKQTLNIKGKPSLVKEAEYFQKQGVMTIAGEKRSIPFGTQDSLSLMYNIRHMDFDKVKDFEFNLNTNQKNYTFKGTSRNKELSVGGKDYKLAFVKAEIFRKDKNPYHRSKVEFVLLKDKENIPILIKVYASGAFINIRLMEIK